MKIRYSNKKNYYRKNMQKYYTKAYIFENNKI